MDDKDSKGCISWRFWRGYGEVGTQSRNHETYFSYTIIHAQSLQETTAMNFIFQNNSMDL